MNRADYPNNAVAYAEPGLRRTLEELGLEIIGPPLYGLQDVLLLGKAPATWIPSQLAWGWHDLEDGSRRWTKRVFAVQLHRARSEYTILRFRFHLPAAIMTEYQTVRLTARVEGVQVFSFEYHSPGEQLCVCDLPDRLWVNESVLVQFELDKSRQPSPPDLRELGLLVALERECPGAFKQCVEPFVLSQASTSPTRSVRR